MPKLKLFLLAFLIPLVAACARLDYDMPASLAVDQPSQQAAQLASRHIVDTMGASGDFQAGDLVRISFPYMPTLDTEQRVQPSGFISPPLLSPIQTRGLTAAALQQQLQQAYKGKLRRPIVGVSLVEYNRKPAPPEFFVLGEVVTPGPKEYHDGLTLMEALARAGGTSRTANLRKVVIVEPAGDRLAARMVDYEALLTGRGLSGDRIVPVLSPSAIVIVPPTNLALSSQKAQQIRSIIGFSGLHLGLPLTDAF